MMKHESPFYLVSDYFACPYCGHANKIAVDDISGWQVMYCDSEAGGCDEPFAVHYRIKVDAECHTISAEGLKREAKI